MGLFYVVDHGGSTAGKIGGLDYLRTAFGMRENDHVRELLSNPPDIFDTELFMHLTFAMPAN
jgi:hypothetical protein